MGGYAATPEEIDQIRALASRGIAISAIAKKLSRSPGFVNRIAKTTGTPTPSPAVGGGVTSPTTAIRTILTTTMTAEEKLKVIAALV